MDTSTSSENYVSEDWSGFPQSEIQKLLVKNEAE